MTIFRRANQGVQVRPEWFCFIEDRYRCLECDGAVLQEIGLAIGS
jgi:hypothetical protein